MVAHIKDLVVTYIMVIDEVMVDMVYMEVDMVELRVETHMLGMKDLAVGMEDLVMDNRLSR